MWAHSALRALACLGVGILGILVLVAERLLPSPQQGQRPDAMRQFLRLSGRVFIAVSVAVLAVPLAPILLMALALVVLTLSWRVGWISILAALAAAAERGIPFDTVLEALAAEERWPARRYARRLLKLLRMGWPLPDALEQVRNPVSWECLAAIRVGQAVGDLATPLRQAYGRLAGKADSWGDLGTRLYYLFVTFVFLAGTVALFQITIMPPFVKILEDFGLTLPPITAAAKGIGGSVWFWGLHVLQSVMGVGVIYALLRYTGAIRWLPPGVGWLVRPFRAADVLDCLALAARQHCAFAGPLAIVSNEYPGWTLRRRLRRVYGDVQAGADWCQSLYRRGVIGKAEALVLEAASQVGNLPWALEEMAAHLRRRHAYRLRTLAMAAFPLCIVGVGALVGLFYVACFYPLLAMIESLTTL